MQLSSLEIKGFKSFGDKITINFNEGITAIVGPNGCGKSNVVDAIRWVLGEQSTRMLRSEKMENIIFNGTRNRKAAQLAEVSLSFNNTKNILPTEFSHVTITRKLFRNGDSEYRLNDVVCRLKDIKDLFLDTGIGSDSYAIIELKMIDEIINNKDHSRRALFEEASGIAKYKIRKKQTASKLTDTEADLSRVDDILFELEKNLKSLENQAKKAEKYLKLKEQYKAMSLDLASFRMSNFNQNLSDIENREKVYQDTLTTFNTAISQLEADIQKLKLDNISQEKNLALQQKTTNEWIHKIRNYESEKKIKNEQLRFLEEKKQKLSEEIEKDKAQFHHTQYNLKRLHEEENIENQSFETQKNDLNQLKAVLDEMRLRLQSEKISVDALNKKVSEVQNQIYKTDKEIEVLNIQKQTLEQESERNIDETENKSVELNAFSEALLVLNEKIKEKTQVKADLEEREEEINADIAEFSQKLEAHKTELAKITRSIDAKQNEYNLTKSLIDNLEGFPESIRFLKKNAQWAKNATLLSDILFCKEEYRVPIENFLDSVMNYYLTQNAQEALQAIQLLSDSAQGRAHFFNLDAFPAVSVTESIPEGCISALSIVDFDPKYKNICEHLLHNVCIVTENEESFFKKAQFQENWTYLSKSGKFSTNSLSFSGGSVGLFEGKRIGRSKNLEMLSKEIKNLSTIADKMQSEMKIWEEKLVFLKESSQKSKIEFEKQQLNQWNTELISLQTKHDQYQEFITNSQNRKTAIQEKVAQINAQLHTAHPKLAELQREILTLQKNQHDATLQYQDLADQVTDENTIFNEKNIKFHQQQNKLNGILKDIEYREVQLETVEKRLTTNESELAQVNIAITETLQFTDTDDAELISMYQERENLEKALQELENQYYQFKEKTNTQETELNLQRKNREETLQNLQNIKDQKNEIKLQFNSLKERLSVEFQIDTDQLSELQIPTHENEHELKTKVEKTKKQLEDYGTINPMAMETYNETAKRYEFIISQKNDLIAAKKDLLQTIKEIDLTASQKFMDAFTHVRGNFITVFRSLFNEEDNCDLVLTNPSDPLDSDIDIIAKPKGKRPLSINQLSGGEKTLTSTALLFSLYLLKPAPFCIFDEVDAPLDDTNIDKFNNIIRKFSNQSQFIIVSHNKKTIASTDIIYGVTMVEQGISRVVPVDVRALTE